MGDTRTEIMEATRTVLSEHGFHDLTTQKVADKIDGGHSLVHYHFDTKENLIVETLEYSYAQFGDTLEELRERPPGDRLATLLTTLTTHVTADARNRYLAILEVQAYAGRHEKYKTVLQTYNQLVFEFVVETIEEGIAEGAFTDCEPEETARLLVTAGDGALLQEYTLDVEAREQAINGGLVEYVLADLYVEGPPDLEAYRDTYPPTELLDQSETDVEPT